VTWASFGWLIFQQKWSHLWSFSNRKNVIMVDVSLRSLPHKFFSSTICIFLKIRQKTKTESKRKIFYLTNWVLDTSPWSRYHRFEALFGGVSTWMGDRPGTICRQRGLTFTSASSQIKFIRKKSVLLVHYTFRSMRYLAQLSVNFLPVRGYSFVLRSPIKFWTIYGLTLKQNSFINNVFRTIIGGKTVLLLN